jgi:membrane fusion protein, copper/silver efflux system
MKYMIYLGLVILTLGCKEKNKQVVKKNGDYYTCTMHPQIRQEGPGKCPICGMTLILIREGEGGGPFVDSGLVLSDQQIQLGNIRVDTLGSHLIGDQMILSATLNMDETKTVTVNARIAGRIEKLYVKTTGEYIQHGERLYDMYSEALNNAKQEYVLALEKQKVLDNSVIDFKQLVESSRHKLLLWGMNSGQIDDLAKTKINTTSTSFYSPADGNVVSLESHEGDFVAEGATILRLTNLSTLWAEAQVYSTQFAQTDPESSAVVQIPGLSLDVPGRIIFVNPEMNPSARINLIRVAIDNPRGLLKPGMPVYVILKNRQSHSLTLPVDAVVRNERGNMVWLMTGHNRFKAVRVKTGLEDGEQVEISSGLQPGDIVVTSGAYLLNSEFIIRHGSEPGHVHPIP